jgi:hypothetical protein
MRHPRLQQSSTPRCCVEVILLRMLFSLWNYVSAPKTRFVLTCFILIFQWTGLYQGAPSLVCAWQLIGGKKIALSCHVSGNGASHLAVSQPCCWAEPMCRESAPTSQSAPDFLIWSFVRFPLSVLLGQLSLGTSRDLKRTDCLSASGKHE